MCTFDVGIVGNQVGVSPVNRLLRTEWQTVKTGEQDIINVVDQNNRLIVEAVDPDWGWTIIMAHEATK
jgi:hypothetical protein